MGVQKIDSKIIKGLKQIYPSINNFIDEYYLEDNLTDKGKPIPGKYDSNMNKIFINSIFSDDEDIKKVIFLHESMHFLFSYNDEELRKKLWLLDKKAFDSCDNHIGGKEGFLWEEFSIKYITIIFFRKNRDLLTIDSENLLNLLKKIDALNDPNEMEFKTYFYPKKFYESIWMNKNTSKISLITKGMDKDISFLSQLNEQFKRDSILKNITNLKEKSLNMYEILNYLKKIAPEK